MKPEPEFFTVDEVASLFRRVPATIRIWCSQNLIDHRRVGKSLLIPRAEVSRLRREGIELAADESGISK